MLSKALLMKGKIQRYKILLVSEGNKGYKNNLQQKFAQL